MNRTEQLEDVNVSRPTSGGQPLPKTKVYTIGYGGRKSDDFLGLLASRGIKTIVDVRRRPRGYRGCYTRAKDPGKGIAGMLAKVGIKYVWLEELGNPFQGQGEWVEAYQGHLDQLGGRLGEVLGDVSGPFCLMCAEKRVNECHRRLIADRLAEAGAEVEHIE